MIPVVLPLLCTAHVPPRQLSPVASTTPRLKLALLSLYFLVDPEKAIDTDELLLQG